MVLGDGSRLPGADDLAHARARQRPHRIRHIIFDLWPNGSFQQLNAFGVVMFTVLIVLVSIAQRISARYGIQERV